MYYILVGIVVYCIGSDVINAMTYTLRQENLKMTPDGDCNYYAIQ